MTRGLAVVVLLAVSAPAHADDVAPWEVGVTDDHQERANTTFAEGNALFAQRAHAAALDKYKAALALWDHPMIRFNLAVTLIRLDRILEAADALERALRYGDQPFTPDLYQQARDYQALIKRQLGYIEVICDEPGTKISLDGKPWFDGPGKRTVRVTTGEHALVAERRGYLTVSRTIVVAGGATVTDRIELVPIESALVYEYRQPRWMPWTLAGAGGVVVLGGLAFSLAGRRQMDRFAREFVNACPSGCEADLSMHPELAEERDGAELKGKIGVGLLITGGAMVAGGVVWSIFNRSQRSLPTIEASPTAGGVSAQVRLHF